jgi:hypothetical protein
LPRKITATLFLDSLPRRAAAEEGKKKKRRRGN